MPKYKVVDSEVKIKEGTSKAGKKYTLTIFSIDKDGEQIEVQAFGDHKKLVAEAAKTGEPVEMDVTHNEQWNRYDAKLAADRKPFGGGGGGGGGGWAKKSYDGPKLKTKDFIERSSIIFNEIFKRIVDGKEVQVPAGQMADTAAKLTAQYWILVQNNMIEMVEGSK